MFVLAFLGGVLTILSPCILPVVPLVFSRAGRSFSRETVPTLAGLAIAFTIAALIATATARWLLLANEVGRYVAIAALGLVAASLISTRISDWISRPLVRRGALLLDDHTRGTATAGRNAVIGFAIGLLWAPCAGPILGLLIAAVARTNATHSALLFFTFALGAVVSLALVASAGNRVVARIKRAGIADQFVRRAVGLATLATVISILFGWDRALFAGATLVRTASAENRLIGRLAPTSPGTLGAGVSLDSFASQEAARSLRPALPVLNTSLPGFDGATEWLNSAALTPEALRGKVVLVDFWTFACYNCLNALPHVKELYAKYKDRGFVVIGIHTPELAHERIASNVRREVDRLGITYPVVIDNDYRIWHAFNNQYWPAAFYADAKGELRFYHFGEGKYDEQEKVVAKLLAERDAAAASGAVESATSR